MAATDVYKKVRGVEFTVGRDRQHIAGVQAEFIREARQRFERLRGQIRRKVGYDEDYFGLQDDTPTQDSATQRVRFRRWLLATAIAVLALDISDRDAERGEHWTARFLENAAVQGYNQATGQLLQLGISVDNPDNDRVRQLVQETLLGRRTLGDIVGDGRGTPRYLGPVREFEDVTGDMADRIDGTLDEGFREGWNPRKMADELNREVRKLERSRAATIARTETAMRHSEETLKRYARHGIEGVGHVSRIVTPDTSLCPWCRRLADETFTLREFSGTRVLWRGQRWFVGVPSHPNGRCAPIPKPGIDPDGLPPIEERLPAGAEVIGEGFMYEPRAVS